VDKSSSIVENRLPHNTVDKYINYRYVRTWDLEAQSEIITSINWHETLNFIAGFRSTKFLKDSILIGYGDGFHWLFLALLSSLTDHTIRKMHVGG
jgi:hypothetical protein